MKKSKKKIPLISLLFPEELFGFLFLTAFLIIAIIYHKIPSFNRITGRHYFYFFSYTVIIAFVLGLKPKGLLKIFRNFYNIW